MQIDLAVSPPLTPSAEAEMLARGLQLRPDNPALRLRLAGLLLDADDFAGAELLLIDEEAQPSGQEAQLLLATALLAVHDHGRDQRAAAICERAVAAAGSAHERATALAVQGKTLLRTGRPEAAEAVLREALQAEPGNVAAFKRLALHLLDRKAFAAVIALVDTLGQAGVTHARLLAARAAALAGLGAYAEARDLLGYDDLAVHRPLPVPPGWSDLAGFNRALEQGLAANPTARNNRFGTASRQTLRVDDPLAGGDPAMHALLGAISDAVADHAAALDPAQHPWIAAMPDRAELRSWCVSVAGDGWEEWHTHPDGWISGGYYIAVPDTVVSGEDEGGCFALGLPEGLVGAAAADAVGQRLIRPQPGSLVLFPSHGYHRTYPHHGEGRRICLAFDICPR